MLSYLPQDMLFEIISFLQPQEFQQLYLSLQDDRLKQCIIQCTTVINDKLVEWFKSNDIVNIHLFEEKRKDCMSTRYFQNGKIHRDGDLPAYISNARKVQCWYQNGKIHRIDKPAHICFYLQSNCVTMMWFHNDKFLDSFTCNFTEIPKNYGVDVSFFV